MTLTNNPATSINSVRTRFAPSPTGYLHVGSARTALYAYLYAKRHQGSFILRIEDTDQERSTQASVDAILDSLSWLGLSYDEGPFYQTKRFEKYRQAAKLLLDQQKAYKCYCSKERLEKLRERQLHAKQKPKYDQFCLDPKNHPENLDNLPYVIRFLNPTDGQVIFDDAVHGKTIFNNTELDDLIIVRSDGVPTYNFCVVIDDWEMKITHVIRGDDHLNNTPRQINILHALGANIPVYAHIPMILGSDSKRLSKRHGAASVMEFREEGFLPQALLNYLVRLGWSHGDQEVFSLSELIRLFDIHDINKSAASMNPQKLLWLNQQYLKTASSPDINPDINLEIKSNIKSNIKLETKKQIKKEFEFQLAHQGIKNYKINSPDINLIIDIQSPRCKTLKEMAEKSRFFYEPILASQDLKQKYITPNIQAALNQLSQIVQDLSENLWTADNLQDIICKTAENFNLKLGDFAQAIRILLAGSTISPPLNHTMKILGKEKVLARLQVHD